MGADLLIKNAKIVTEQGVISGSLAGGNGRVFLFVR